MTEAQAPVVADMAACGSMGAAWAYLMAPEDPEIASLASEASPCPGIGMLLLLRCSE